MPTLAEAINEVRVLLQDTAAPQRYAEEELFSAVVDSLRDVLRVRPDLFVRYNYRVPRLPNATAQFPLGDQWFRSVVYMGAGYVMLRDDEFANDGRAAALMAMGVGAFTGG